MKKTFFALLLALITLPAWSNPSDSKEVPLKPKSGHESEHPWHKAPGRNTLPTVIYNEEEAVLTFYGVADLGSVAYTMKNETGESVASGYVTILRDEEDTVSVAALPVGDYTLEIDINGKTYVGEFTIE